MKKLEIKKGVSFGKLTIIKEVFNNRRDRYFLCECKCGNKKEILLNSLRRNRTKSCGCLRDHLTSKRRKKHGMRESPTYNSWSSLLQRVTNHKCKSYKNYGGRGINVCDRWKKFENFYEDMGDKPTDRSLDRIDNNGNYCKENCRWATKMEQANNTRSNRFIAHKGVSHTVAEWSKILKVNNNLIKDRIKAGWSIKKTLTTPARKIT